MARRAAPKYPEFLTRLEVALKRDLDKLGLKVSSIRMERVSGTKLHRFFVVAKFSKLGHLERQEVVWNIVKKELSPEEHIHVSMIETLTPGETKGGYRFASAA